ncbi:protein translocase subunit SecF [Psychromonas ossibalaenae]|uniref:protein translocase subunit SecF n=1 Tax=Psychromonas ossibalaenae TaxID=444922 RepID=UPI000364E207|nr:protein translocase subunit SecF [Psychromonas ossibalaenae]
MITQLTRLRFYGCVLGLVAVLLSFAGLLTFGLNQGLEFTGGIVTEINTTEVVNLQDMSSQVSNLLGPEASVSLIDDGHTWSIRQPLLKDPDLSWFAQLGENTASETTLLNSSIIGPQVGDELLEQGGLAMLAAVLAIFIYLAFRFEWRFAFGAVLALFHDVVITLGIFAWSGLEFNLTVLAAVLAVIGYSLNDSIVVADRIREILRSKPCQAVSQSINQAICSTMSRTLITSGTTLTTVGAIWLLAGRPLQGFSTALFFGIVVGTISSICIAPTLPERLGLRAEDYQPKEPVPELV